MKTKTLQLLKITPQQYEEKTMDSWVKWCQSRIVNEKSLQKVLICQPLFNWWQRELEKLELEFVQDMELINQRDPEACMQAYNFTTRRIFKRFSKPLIQKANDSKTVGEQS